MLHVKAALSDPVYQNLRNRVLSDGIGSCIRLRIGQRVVFERYKDAAGRRHIETDFPQRPDTRIASD